jgi:hypothetical protein
MSKRVFAPKREEVTIKLRKVHKQKLHNLFLPVNIMKVTKLRRISWAGHEVFM